MSGYLGKSHMGKAFLTYKTEILSLLKLLIYMREKITVNSLKG